ncbi:polysaccharide biosynthesis C-terminal domain-containing protein [Pseudomonadales bacterium]|nr:polysaccharide biosynthesis C-terminal domain-containing protein [Pseudomonadales bacterium]
MRALGALSILSFNLLSVKQLGAEQAGYLFICVSIVTFLSTFSRLGFENTVLRFTSANAEKGNTVKSILDFSFKYAIIFSVSIASLLFYLAPSIANGVFKSNSMLNPLQNIAPVVVGLTITFIVSMSLQARLRIISSVPCQGLTHILIFSVCILAFNTKTASAAASVFSFSVFVSAVYYYCIAIRGLNNNGEKIASEDMWLSSRSNWSVSMCTSTMQVGAIVIIGIYLPAEEASYFSAAQRLALVCSFLLTAINVIIPVKLSQYSASGDVVKLKRTSILSVRLMLACGLPLVVLLYSFSSFLMGLFGEGFLQRSSLLEILLIGQLVSLATGSAGNLLMMTGNERYMNLSVICPAIFFLIFTPIATLKFGATGAATITAISIIMQNLLCIIFVKKQLGFNMLVFWQKV